MEYSTAHLDYLARTFLDDYGGVYAGAVGPSEVHLVDGNATVLLRVQQLGRTWDPRSPVHDSDTPRYRSRSLLAGYHGIGMPVLFGVRSDGNETEILLGTHAGTHAASSAVGDGSAVLGSLLEGHYPGSRVEAAALARLWPVGSRDSPVRHVGVLTGLPTIRRPDEVDSPTQLDQVVRAMAGYSWGLALLAEPLSGPLARDLQHAALNEMRNVENLEQNKSRRGPLAEAYYRRLGLLASEYEQGTTEGIWTTSVYYAAQDRESFDALGSTLASCFGGDQSFPDPVRVIELANPGPLHTALGPLLLATVPPPGAFEYPHSFQTLLSTGRLSALVHMPRFEVPGLVVRKGARFDVAPTPPREPLVAVGQVLDRARPLAQRYEVSMASLAKHALIVGVTGSGKTNTTFHLLRQLWGQRVPFLVLEPAKTEYRTLLGDDRMGADLRVFTLGDETVSPVRINPFQVGPGASLATHIDLLKAVFNAAFAMWSPLPQVLERCLHEVYRDRGWDPVRGTNRRATGPGMRPNPYVTPYPTLADLVAKADEVVDRLGYDDRVTSDIRAALLTRLESLRIGGKGRMLDTPTSTPMEALLSGPTVLELEQIGDDDEKAFLLGLLLLRLYEYRRTADTSEHGTLRHVVVIEEAHRLLANVPTLASAEQANTRGQAVETFVHMLSEVRAYGQGFVIAEQIPTKLAPDALKNTLLKIIHRTVAGDDRDAMARMTNADEEQSRTLATLDPGQAAIFSEGDDAPVMVEVPYVKLPTPPTMATHAASDDHVRLHMDAFHRDPERASLLLPFESCARECPSPYYYCDDADRTVGSPGVREAFGALVLAIVANDEVIAPAWNRMLSEWRSSVPMQFSLSDTIPCLLNHSVRRYFTNLGRRYGWSFDTANDLASSLAAILLGINAAEGADTDRRKIAGFRDNYLDACLRTDDPYYGCSRACPSGRCTFRHHVAPLVADPNLAGVFHTGMQAAARQPAWSDLRPLDHVASRLGGPTLPQPDRRSLALCYGLQQLTANPTLLHEARVLATDKLISSYDQQTPTTDKRHDQEGRPPR